MKTLFQAKRSIAKVNYTKLHFVVKHQKLVWGSSPPIRHGLETFLPYIVLYFALLSLEGQQDSNPEHSTTETNKDKDNQEQDHRGVPLNCSEHTERLMAAQSAELLAMDDEFKAFRKNWEKNFRGLQERHKKEQERLFELDNCGYEM